MSGTFRCIPRLLLKCNLLGKQRRRVQKALVPDLAWKSKTSFHQPLATSQSTFAFHSQSNFRGARNSGKNPERPRKRSQSFSWNSPREYGWDPPSPIIQGILELPEHLQNNYSLPLSTAGDPFFQKCFQRGPLRAGHGIPGNNEGISEFAAASLRPQCTQARTEAVKSGTERG